MAARLNMPEVENASEQTRRGAAGSGGSLEVSRRTALGVAGAAAVGGSTAVKALETTLSGGFSFSQAGGRAVFRFRGRDAWVIDPKQFGGCPRLKVEQSQNLIRIRLSQAVFPGTSIPADFRAEIRRGLSGWRIRLSLGLAKFEASTNFESWLGGSDHLEGSALLRPQKLPLDPYHSSARNPCLTLSGEGDLSFAPDWLISFRAKNAGQLHGFGEAASSLVSLRLMRADEPSLLTGAHGRRTLISATRGRATWSIALPATPEGSSIGTVASGFDAFRMECRLSRVGAVDRVLQAVSERDGPSVMFYPATDIVGFDRKPFGLPIRDTALAVVAGTPGLDVALTGSYNELPAWLHLDTTTVALGIDPRADEQRRAAESPSLRFMLRDRDGKISLDCAPDIVSFAAGMDSAVVEPQPLREPARLEVVFGQTRRKKPAGTGRLTVRNDRPISSDSATRHTARHELVVPNPVVSLLRPEDLLALRLEYYGFDLEAGGGSFPILRNITTGDPNAYMVAFFAPQNIAEQAFFEQAPAGGVRNSYDQNGNPTSDPGQESPSAPGTILNNIAGESRLAFDIFNSEIPYSLNPYQLPAIPSVARSSARKGFSFEIPPVSVLDWKQFQQRVGPTALPPTQTPPLTPISVTEPTTDQTSIEAPYRVMLSPSTYAFWNHAIEPKPGPGGEVELWHTRLGVNDGNGNYYDDDNPTEADLRTVRAVWSPDYTTDKNVGDWPQDYAGPVGADQWNPYRSGLGAEDRFWITTLTSDFNNTQRGGTTPFVPQPAGVNRLALSTLGAWIDLKADWDVATNPEGIDLVEWVHRGTMARDHYVKVVFAGYLYPFGHKAVLIRVTERKFFRYQVPGTSAPGPIVAYLRQHDYIQVREPVKSFTQADYLSTGTWQKGWAGREMAFKSVKFTTLVTPDIEAPLNSEITKYNTMSGDKKADGSSAFWPKVLINGVETDFMWHVVGTDWDGNEAAFTLPLIFVAASLALPPASTAPTNPNIANDLAVVNGAYTDKTAKKNVVPMNGQKIAFAQSDSSPTANGSDPAMHVNSVTFTGRIPPNTTQGAIYNLDPDQPQFWPAFANSNVEIPAIKHMLGKNSVTNVAPAQQFLQHGFDGASNKGEIFLQMVSSAYDGLNDLTSQQLPLVFGQGDSGQVVTPGTLSPNLSIAGLSRSIGPVGAQIQSGISQLNSIASGNYDPTDFFDPNSLLGGSLPKLFGAISLPDILGNLSDFTQYLNKVPGLTVTRTDTAILIHYFIETEQINPWQPTGNPVSATALNTAVLAPWVIDSEGNELVPMNDAGNAPRYQQGGNIIPPPVHSDAPPPPPQLALDNNGSDVDGGGTDPTHVWVATYVLNDGKNYETVASLGNVLSMPDGGSDVTVTVDVNPSAKAINVYRSKQGTAWPLYRIEDPGSNAGMILPSAWGTSKTVDYSDKISDDSLTDAQITQTWMQVGIDIRFKIPLDGTDPTYSIIGEVAYASLQMDVIAVPFYGLTFKVDTGAKLTVEPRVGDIVFVGPLQFVNKLRDFLNNFSDPPFLDVSATGIDAGYTLTIPTIDCGVLNLANISLGAKITVPFFGDSVVVGFLFCSKENPFVLTVYIFGGGGWLEIDIAPDGLVGFHAGFEFGAEASLDIGVASGSVHVMAGIYYDYDKPSRTSSLTGFVDLGGSLDVLCIISVSLDFHLQLTYTNDAGASSVTGEATLTIDIKIVFVSIPVKLGPVRKTFAGSTSTAPSGDFRHALAEDHIARKSDSSVPVAVMIQPDTWASYVNAFAA